MNVNFLTAAQATRTLIRLVSECKYMDIAVAWAGINPVVDAMLEHPEKLRHLVIGTHMYQTDPKVLRRFIKVDTAKCMPPHGRLFHPKVYLFEMKEGFAAVVGSHNLTGGAFGGRNVEASLLLRAPTVDKVMSELANFIIMSWNAAESIEEDGFLFAYEAQYEANKAKRQELEQFHRLKKPRLGTSKPSPLKLSWVDIVEGVKADKQHSLEGRLSILERATRLFTERSTFVSMDRDERRAIAGTYGSVEKGLEGLPWGWFGTMFGQGDFKNLVNESPEELSAALDHIPLKGEVEENHYIAFAVAFNSAFEGKAHKGGVATASRLLTMKRPDQFVGVNDANRRSLCDAFGVAFSTLSLENYWERIVIPIQLSSWWLQSRPTNPINSRIWDNRAALLDCIYYIPKPKK